MKYSLTFLSLILLFSCSIEKRHYRKGHYVHWKSKPDKELYVTAHHKSKSSATASANIKQEKLDIPFSSALNKLTDFTEPAAQQPNPIAYDGFRHKSFKINRSPQDSIKTQIIPSDEEQVKRLSKKSHVLGIITLISTILFIFYIFTVPTAIICGILAIKRGRQAIKLMGKNVELNSKYRSKAIKGIRLGMSFFYFLITLLFLGLILGIIAGAFILIILTEFSSYLDLVYFGATLVGIIAIYFTIMLYIYIIKKIRDTVPKAH